GDRRSGSGAADGRDRHARRWRRDPYRRRAGIPGQLVGHTGEMTRLQASRPSGLQAFSLNPSKHLEPTEIAVFRLTRDDLVRAVLLPFVALLEQSWQPEAAAGVVR